MIIIVLVAHVFKDKLTAVVVKYFIASSVRGTRPLSSATCRKKIEPNFVVSSEDVLEAMAMENEEVGMKIFLILKIL